MTEFEQAVAEALARALAKLPGQWVESKLGRPRGWVVERAAAVHALTPLVAAAIRASHHWASEDAALAALRGVEL